MKTLTKFWAAVLISLPTLVNAEEFPDPPTNIEEAEVHCLKVKELAYIIMRARQKTIWPSMFDVGFHDIEDQYWKEILFDLSEGTYLMPQAETLARREELSHRYSEREYLSCLREHKRKFRN